MVAFAVARGRTVGGAPDGLDLERSTTTVAPRPSSAELPESDSSGASESAFADASCFFDAPLLARPATIFFTNASAVT